MDLGEAWAVSSQRRGRTQAAHRFGPAGLPAAGEAHGRGASEAGSEACGPAMAACIGAALGVALALNAGCGWKAARRHL